ncbi:hypothetical protein J19TS1_21790 [Heyndrickxia oleronia]|jgi:hypothetical protein|nr:hypothetical protein J19TS1_21790 [Heyndrickxia oleronia]
MSSNKVDKNEQKNLDQKNKDKKDFKHYWNEIIRALIINK